MLRRDVQMLIMSASKQVRYFEKHAHHTSRGRHPRENRYHMLTTQLTRISVLGHYPK
jgi:hypothetical protein